jgi:hypothetical protein
MRQDVGLHPTEIGKLDAEGTPYRAVLTSWVY